jgi:hypothetical protein
MTRKIPVIVRFPLQRIAPKSRVNEVCQEDLEKSAENGSNMLIMDGDRE